MNNKNVNQVNFLTGHFFSSKKCYYTAHKVHKAHNASAYQITFSLFIKNFDKAIQKLNRSNLTYKFTG